PLGRRSRVALARDGRFFTLELAVPRVAVGVETPGLERLADRASRLGIVRAVGEAAGARQRLDIREHRREAGVRVPELELAHSGRVDDDPAAVDQHELAVGGRMTPAAIREDR